MTEIQNLIEEEVKQLEERLDELKSNLESIYAERKKIFKELRYKKKAKQLLAGESTQGKKTKKTKSDMTL